MTSEDDTNLAILIDADNVSYTVISGLIAEAANYGTASVRRIYGDWTSPYMKGWRECLLEHSITPIQQFAYTTGKNAMDLLYTGRFSSFCLVSSDSDFTRLASRIREQGVTVYGFGKRNTNLAFVRACNKFIYFDALSVVEVEAEAAASIPPLVEQPPLPPVASRPEPSTPGRNQPSTTKTYPLRPPPLPLPVGAYQFARNDTSERITRPFDTTAISALRSAITMAPPYEEDFVNLAEVGLMLGRISPNVNARNYGYQRLKEFIEASGLVETRMKQLDGRPPVALVRLKESEAGVAV